MTTYEILDDKTFRVDDKGERTMLANFSAKIVEETRYIDGRSSHTVLRIGGAIKNKDGDTVELPITDVEASDFPGLQWVMKSWGVKAVISPGSAVKDDLRTAIQLNSSPELKTIYRHIGWTEINGEKTFLHANGGITKKGNDPSVEVQLPTELSHYSLAGPADADIEQAIMSTLALTELAPAPVAWTLLAATVAPAFGPVDFAIHLTGRTGTFKSELISLFQSHYGAEMDARHLPGSWSSTANALEAQAFHAKNAPFAIDDFVPTGTSWQVRAYQTTADKIIRAQGNQSGRARLTDTSTLQTAMYPRGIILSTGEDTPEGHSVRARMMILELSPGDIDVKNLTQAQSNRELYPVTMAAFLQELCKTPVNIKEMSEEIRNGNLEVGHTRTPSMLGRLLASANVFLDWCGSMLEWTDKRTTELQKTAEDAIKTAADNQSTYLESADPCDVFCATVRSILGSGHGHFRTVNGGIPGSPTMLGWTEEQTLGDLPTYKSHGPCLGWVDWTADEIFIDITGGFNAIKKNAGADIPLTKQTLIKRLKDASLLTRTDEGRQRNTVRITAEKHPRQVLALPLSTILDTQEKSDDEQQPTGTDG
jgi:hypothetical protein